VRFRRAGAIHELLSHAVQARLREPGPEAAATVPVSGWRVPMGGPQSPSAAGAPLPTLRFVDMPPSAPPWTPPPAANAPSVSTAPLSPPVEPSADAEGGAGLFASLRIIGQLFEGYLIGESHDRLVLIDQHAAHERVMFEHLRAAYSDGVMGRQHLLLPAIVEVGPREKALLQDYGEQLQALGFEVEPFGGTSVAVRAVPALLSDAEPAALLRDVAEELADIGGSRRLAEAAESVLARLACHSAVRVGQRMGPQQIRSLLSAMDRIDFAGHCPHGRPAYVTFSRGELERWFKRT
jgi:DNA mismatch repair protein MutL